MSDMKLRFKHQQFQADATNAVCDVFSGQPRRERSFLIDQGTDKSGITQQSMNQTGWANPEINLREEDILKNLRQIQTSQSNILPNRTLEKLVSKVERLDGSKETVSRPVFTVEMETGTGKTYTYIKTMYEMNIRYGWSKFIIVVPSIAIREGVAKTFETTVNHFKEEYGKACRYFIYNSSRLNELEQFADDSGINVMIINSQAFAARGKDALRIDMRLDSFRSRKPIDIIAAVNPIVIIDEPQSVIGVESSKNVTRHSLGKFNPLFYINYSATHRENFNMVYRLDAVDAYQKQLVKKIAVKGISVIDSAATNGYLYLQKINVYPNKSPSATVVFEHNALSGAGIRKKVKTFTEGDNIYDHSGEIEAYRDGYRVGEINAGKGYVEFTNSRGDGGTRISLGQVIGDSNEEDVRRIQIRETIASHLERERELFKKGIKVLSLFFIDEVAKYKYYDDNGEQKGTYAKIFEKEYKAAVEHFFEQLPFEEDKEYREYLNRDTAEQLHKGYFSVDKKGRAVDSEVKRGESESSDTSAYDLIMKNKEQLLGLDEPVRFIFSHSALREGWDNPNVFQICTLRMSSGDIKKRQEIGRGLRLSVNKDGERMDSDVLGAEGVHELNVLTVIANESYDDFARTLQDEFAEVLKNRPTSITPDLFTGRVWSDEQGNEITINSSQAARIFFSLEDTSLVKDGQLTDKYFEMNNDLRAEAIGKILKSADKDLVNHTNNALQLIDSVYDIKKNPLSTDTRKEVPINLDQDKFASKQFKELWEQINHKTYYTVHFNEEELIKVCVENINRNLRVSQTMIVVTEGYLKSTKQDNLEMLRNKIGKQIVREEYAAHGVTFDLIGELTKETNLTRRTIATILQKIEPSVFAKFAKNPEGFIREAITLINEQKTAAIVKHIEYDLVDERWSADDIFVTPKLSGIYGENMIDAKKHIFDKVRYDSKTIEKTFAENLDVSDVVELYIKLPSGFYINTPMGQYNPDWAISFREGSVKHIYFVAETKGESNINSLSFTSNTGDSAKAKIECARRHFEKISSNTVKFSAVKTFAELMVKVNS